MATGGESNQERESNQKRFSNWLQCVNSLNETKTALHDHVLEIWKKEILSWDKDLRDHLPRFLICVSEDTISDKENKKGKHKRKQEWYCKCEHAHCGKILKHLLSIQHNPGSRIIWNNELCKQLAKENLETEPDTDNDDDMENIPRVETSILALFLQMLFEYIGLTSRKQDCPSEVIPEIINYEDIFGGCKQEHIWCIANMFMHHGKGENKIANTGPGNTDASMLFRMMQNCKLFEIEDQNNLYEEILSCRNRLHHSANNRVSQKDAESHLDTMITFLKQFEEVPKCKDAIESIEKAQKETILSVSVPDKTLKELSKKALKLKKTALEVDREMDKSSGFTSDESNGLLEKTTEDLQKISDQPSGDLSNIESSIRESSQRNADEYARKKDPGKHFENMTKLLKMHADKKDISEALAEQLNPLIDQIVEDVSWKDEEIKESLKVVYGEEKHEYEREKEENTPLGSDNTEAEDVAVQSPDMEEHDDSENLKSTTQLRSDSGVTNTQTNSSHVWSKESEQNYTIKVEVDSEDCYISGCCMLPTGEILLADWNNNRLKKLNDRYQVISVCDLPSKPWDVCYCGNNEAVLAMGTSLQFVDIRGGMSLTRKVKTDHTYYGLTCHGSQLYVVHRRSVFIYSTDGIKQRVLYTTHSRGTFFLHIAVSDDGNYIYITDFRQGLHTIDSVGNHLYTFTDTQLSGTRGVCVDGEGHVLVSEFRSDKVLQVSSDGKQKLGIIVANISKIKDIQAMCFNRSNATLVAAGWSNKIYVFKLK